VSLWSYERDRTVNNERMEQIGAMHMNANAKRRTHDEDDNTPQQRYSTEARLAVVETRWQDAIPTLATKSDIELVKKDIEATEHRLNAKIDAQTNKLLIQLPAIILAILGLFGIVMKFLSGTPVQQPAPIIQSAPAPVQPATTPAPPATPERTP